MHQKAIVNNKGVRVVDCDGTSYALKNQLGILKRLDMENELEYIDSYISQAQDDISFYHKEMLKERKNMVATATTGVGSVATFAAVAPMSTLSPVTYWLTVGMGAGLGLALFGSATGFAVYSNWTLDDYRKLRKAAVSSLALSKYKEQYMQVLDKDISSLQFVDGECEFDTSYWRGAKMQADLGLAPLNHGWYDPGFLGTRHLRKKYGISKLEMGSHIKEVLANKKSKTKCKI